MLKLVLAGLLLTGVNAAHATPTTWFLEGMTFNTNTTATGSFVYDADTNTYSSINISVTKDGNTNNYGVLNPSTASNGHALNTVQQLLPDLTGQPHLKLLFESQLSNAGGSINILTGVSSYQGFCAQANCNTYHSPFDDVTAGQVSTTPPPPTPPAIVSNAAASVPENQTSAIDVQAIDDNDSEGSGLTFSISGGADQSLFDINIDTGVVTFSTAPDFENPADAGADNNYDFQVSVADSASLTTMQDIVITVTNVGENTPPSITSSAIASIPENQTNAIDVQAIDAQDFEGAGLTFSKSGGADQALFSIDTNTGVVTFGTAPDFENPTDAGADNNYNLQVTVTDSGALTAVQNIVITVTNVAENAPPSITSSTIASVLENQTSAIDVQAIDDDDSEGAGLTFSKSGGADQALFNIDTDTGVVTFVTVPDFEVPSDAGGDNNYDLQVTVTDSGTLTATQDIVITVTDVAENSAPVLDAIGNQTVNEGQLLEIVISASDPDAGDVLTFQLGNPPTGATLTNNGNGTATFSWTPDFDQAGNYPNVLFTVADDGVPVKTDMETITITVGGVNRPPQFDAPGSQTIDEGAALNFDVQATDPDGNAITLAISNQPGGAAFVDNGNGSGSFIWTPDFGQAGNFTVMFVATDDGAPAQNDTLEVTITVGDVNRPPVMSMIGDRTVAEGEQLEFTLTATDPDGNNLSYTSTNVGTLTGSTFTDNGDGTASFSWTPDFGQSGSDTVMFTVTDDGIPAISDSEIITITVGDVNRPPVLSMIGDRAISEGERLEFTLTATDPDGNNLSYASTNLDNLSGSSFNDNGDGTALFSWTPDFAQAGNFAVMFTVTDDGLPASADSESITITVGNVNRPPVLSMIGDRTVTEGGLLEFTLTGSDPDGDSLSYSIGNAPAGATVNDNGDGTATFRWMPTVGQAGSFPGVSFTVTDNGLPESSASENITITVTSGGGDNGGGGGGGGSLSPGLLFFLGLLMLLRSRRGWESPRVRHPRPVVTSGRPSWDKVTGKGVCDPVAPAY